MFPQKVYELEAASCMDMFLESGLCMACGT